MTANPDDDDDRALRAILTRPAPEVDDLDLAADLPALLATAANVPAPLPMRVPDPPRAPAVRVRVTRRARATSFLSAASAAAALALFVAFGRSGGPEPRAKGAPGEQRTGLEVFVVDDGGVPRRAHPGAAMRASDGLAFAVTGPDSAWAVIYGVDDDKRVFWFYPADGDGDGDGAAAAVRVSPGDLPDVVRHDLHPGKLAVHARFSPAPFTQTSGAAGDDLVLELTVAP